jgi:hypothetical protein
MGMSARCTELLTQEDFRLREVQVEQRGARAICGIR